MVRRITRAGVIGSGLMGSGIAALLASVGVDTLMLDIVPPDVADEASGRDARNRVARTALERLVSAKPPMLMHPRDAVLISIGNLEDDFGRLAECDWIVEVALEDLAVKRDLLKKIDAVRRPGTIVSTNTSSIPLAMMLDGLSDDLQAHFLGTHFFNPVRAMHLLEIIPGQHVDASVVAFMTDFGRRILGKGVVLAKDTPNFIANRIGVQCFTRAVQLALEHNMTIPEVDALLGSALGRPFTAVFGTLDLIGLDTFVHVADNAHSMVREDPQTETLKMPDFVRTMCDRGMVGDKAGGGFYRRTRGADQTPVRLVLDPATLEYVPLSSVSFPSLERAKAAPALADKIRLLAYGDDRGARFVWESLSSHITYAAALVPEIADSIADVDAAMRWGFNFSLGPFETWDALGIGEAVHKMDETGVAVPSSVRAMSSEKRPLFYKKRKGGPLLYDVVQRRVAPLQPPGGEVSLAALKLAGAAIFGSDCGSVVDVGDGVLFCELRPRAKTRISDVAALLAESLRLAEQDAVGLVLGADPSDSPRGFWPGGELQELVALADREEFEALDDLLRLAQDSGSALRRAPVPVVAAPFGGTTGWGCQLCLAWVDRVVAHAELRMGLTDCRAGLPPAMGGCLGLCRKLDHESLGSSESLLDGSLAPAITAYASGRVSTSAAEARSLGLLSEADRIVFNQHLLIREAKREVLRLSEDGYMPPAPRLIAVAGSEANGLAAAQVQALRLARRIDDVHAAAAECIAAVIGGGDVPHGEPVAEQVILDLERQVFVSLMKHPESREIARGLLDSGRVRRT